jgi:hypothetical protein
LNGMAAMAWRQFPGETERSSNGRTIMDSRPRRRA